MQEDLTKIHGLSSKLLTIPTQEGVYSYNLGDYQTSDLGAGTKVIAILFRYAPSSGYKSVNDRPLISEEETQKGYLNLVNLDAGKSNILSNHNLLLLTRESTSSYGVFIPPCSINWGQSVVEFIPTINFDGSKDLEFNLLYITPCQTPIQPNLMFDNGFCYNATKKKTIQVNTKANEKSFSIGQNPLSSCDRVVGLNYNNFDYSTIDERTAPLIDKALGASFLTLRIGSRLLLEDFPLTELKALSYLGYPYFPIEPTLSKDFDWSNCKINVSDKSLSQDNTSYLITLYYI